ncbi:HNH endonuclease signature motif containing protein [Bdellovibrionota bacterium FG-2]
MRLLKDVPSAAASIQSGALNLSTVSAVQCFLKREERDKGKTYSPEEKRGLLTQMEKLSVRECEKVLFQVSPESAKAKESSRVVSSTETELRVVVSIELMKKLEKLKGLLAHSHPNPSLAQLFEFLADRTLEQIDPDQKNERRKRRQESRESKELKAAQATPAPESVANSNPRQIPAAIRAEVWERDGGKCTFVSPQTGKKCESTHGLEYDHKIPVVLGGGSEVSNLRILCSHHNAWEAIQKIGHSTMKRYIPDLK